MGNIRDPLSFVVGLTGGTPDVRVPLDFVEAPTGGNPNLRAPLALAEPLTGGNPNVRANFVTAEPLTGGNPNVRVALIIVEALIPVPEELPVATLVFPTLSRNLKWDRAKEPSFNNARRETTSGKRSVTAFMQYPRWNFELAYDVLPAQELGVGGVTELEAISKLFQATQGGAKTFLYRDSDDWHVEGGAIATGDGVTLQWPFFAEIQGGIPQPVGQIDLSELATFASTAVNATTDQVHIPGHGLTTGQNPPMFIANTGGALPTGLAALTPYWPIVIDADHIQLAASQADAVSATAIDITAAGSGTDTLSKGWAAYDNGTLLGPADVSLTMPNQLVFASAPDDGHAITADFDFWFVCRFDDDKLELSEFMSKLWNLQKLNFSSEV